MKILRLRLRNLRCFRDLQSPEFARVNLIAGPNGSGKSTLKDAISLLLSGTATGCETGQGLAGLRARDGAPDKTWDIAAKIRVGEPPLDRDFSRTDSEGPRSKRQDLIEALTGVTGAKARACIHAGELLRLDAKARQRLVLDFAPRQLVQVPADVRKAAEVAGVSLPEAVDLPEIERLHKAAYEARTATHRTVQALGTPEPPPVPDGFDDAAALSIAELTETGLAMRTTIAELGRQRDAALAKAVANPRDIRHERLEVERAETAHERACRELKALPDPKFVAERVARLMKDAREAAATNAEIEARRKDLAEKLTIARAEEKRAATALDALAAETGSHKCPLCEYELGAARRAKVQERLKARLEAARRQITEVEDARRHTIDPLSTVQLEGELAGLTQVDAKRESLAKAKKDAESALAKAQAALAAAEADPGAPGDPKAAEQAEALAARITEGNRRMEVLSGYVAARKAHEAAIGAKAKCKAEWAAHNALVEALGPGGIRKAAGGGGLLKFHDDLNALLEPLGFRVDLRPVLDLEDDPLVSVAGRTVPARFLSHSEQIRFSAAFACAVATYTGLGVVVVDDFEALDPESRAATWELLVGSSHQVFLLAVQTSTDFPATAAGINAQGGDVRAFVLSDGQLLAPTRAEEAA